MLLLLGTMGGKGTGGGKEEKVAAREAEVGGGAGNTGLGEAASGVDTDAVRLTQLPRWKSQSHPTGGLPRGRLNKTCPLGLAVSSSTQRPSLQTLLRGARPRGLRFVNVAEAAVSWLESRDSESAMLVC
jgi:hypothetical protein